MKEIHAYRNEDGTYRIEGIKEVFNGKELIDATVKFSRTRISIDALADVNGAICDVVIQNDDTDACDNTNITPTPIKYEHCRVCNGFDRCVDFAINNPKSAIRCIRFGQIRDYIEEMERRNEIN